MSFLIAGLLLFLGVHSVRIVADDWRTALLKRIGERKWKGLFALVSLVGFVLIVWGFGRARMDPSMLWSPPLWTRHLAAALLLPAFVLIVAGNLRGTKMKAALGHPMLFGTALWALAHLLTIGRLAAVVLFGSFLLWALAAYVTSRRRDAAAGVIYPAGRWSRDLLAVAIGATAWIVFGLWLHGPLIGVRPFG